MNRTWTGIHIWVGVVTGLILPMYFLIPESVRWLAQNGKQDEAMDALLRIAKINGKSLSTDDKTKVYNESFKNLILGVFFFDRMTIAYPSNEP